MNKQPWTQEDAVAFREFYSKHPHIFDAATARKPKAEATSLEVAALNGQKRDGFDLGVEAVRALLDDNGDVSLASDYVAVDKDS